jgi:metal-dependent HD superfamily phosphatase/phosphodiesterase
VSDDELPDADEAPPTQAEASTGFDLLTSGEPPPAGPTPLKPAEVIQVPARRNATLQRVLQVVNADEDLHAIWRCQNVNAVVRLGMSDHGPIHVRIVANSALRLLRLLARADVEPSCVSQHSLTYDDAEVIVFLAALLHDSGMSIHRGDHEQYSLFVAHSKLLELLRDVYPPAIRRVVISETLHAIISHRADGRPLTLEGGIVRVADALDMAKGRSRIPFEAGQVNIHSVSAAAIEAVELGPGELKPIRIHIVMSNAAGLFQLDELLRDKLKGSGLEEHVEVFAEIEGESDKRLFQTYRV